jgi:transcriptional regulator with XRE-family HTH domain
MSVSRRQSARAFGRALRAARLLRGLSQEQLAESGDFDRTYPSLLERGLRTPTFFVILCLADGRGIPANTPATNRKPSQEIRYRHGDNLKRFREERGYTQCDLAALCDMHKNYSATSSREL